MYKIYSILLSVLMFVIPINSSSFGWGFKKNDNHEQPYIGTYQKEIEDTNSYYVGDKDTKQVFLTFDAGYDNGNMIKILDVLSEKDIIATFFITGDFLERFSDLVIEMSNRGHIIGNHTWSHSNISLLGKNQIYDEIQKVENKYKELTGKTIDKYFRPPAGVFNNKSLKIIKSIGYSTIFWSVAYKDWETNNQGNIDKAVNSVIENLHNGAIILLHTVSSDNVIALPKIIDEIRNQGYEINSINNLFYNDNLLF